MHRLCCAWLLCQHAVAPAMLTCEAATCSCFGGMLPIMLR
jgi:hypothetical protein